MTKWLLLMAGAAFGAVLRQLINMALDGKTAIEMPTATLAVNILGSFLLSVAMVTVPPRYQLAVMTGFCGAFTTMSAVGQNFLLIADAGRFAFALGYAVLNLALSISAAALGRTLALRLA